MKEITTVDEARELIAGSQNVPTLLFKHSTTCPISARAAMRVQEFIESAPENAPAIHLIKVIESRPVSNAIAADLGVTHQSPQMILVSGGKAVWDASHGNITPAAIEEAIRAHLVSR